MKKVLLTLFLLISISLGGFAQPGNGLSPEPVDASDASIKEMGHLTMTVNKKVVFDSLTMRTDTLTTVKDVDFNTEPGTARARAARRNAKASDFYDKDYDSWLDMWWFVYTYPSVNADGERVTLSSLACMPDEDCDYVNNVIIGCHVTITSNKQCPSRYSAEGSAKSDVSMLMNHAGSGLVLHSAQSDMPYYNLVIMPDYEGYGETRSHAHPYLYQELTARQVVDGVRYGIALYKTDSKVSSIRHPFRNGWRSISLGYSQGGSVALATHRFIEQNGLTDELQFAGSVCGDGPYDLMSTLMYYVQNEKKGKALNMPVVMPLILKGMCDCNPYMTDHKVSDYLNPLFLETGILDWLNDKNMTTDDITDQWKYLWKIGKKDDAEGAYDYYYYRSVLNSDGTSNLSWVLRDETLTYFSTLYDQNKDNFTSATGIPLPTKRGLMEDLHFALESNNLTMGWKPQHPMLLYHSYEDTVVPEVNRLRADNTIGDWVIKLHASGSVQFDHETTGIQFYLGTAEFNAIRALAHFPVHPTMEQMNQLKRDYGIMVPYE